MNNQLKRRIQQIAILVGVVIIPLMYSFFYLNAFWDPYARLDDVPVAVVNLDEGAVINGESRNLGDEISDNLKEDGSVGFVFTDEYDAAEGLEGNRYYATITIPKDFSEKLAAATSTDSADSSAEGTATAPVDTEKLHSTIIYRSNQKKNYLAAQILENVMPQVKEQVNAKIDEQIIGALSGELEGVPDQLGELADGLEQLSSGASTLKDGTAALMTGAGTLSTGMQTLNDKVPALTNGAAALNDGASQLADGTESLNNVFTMPDHRRKGYASALVREVAQTIIKKEHMPMLYTDAEYEPSNKCYEALGFVRRGSLCTLVPEEKK